MPDAKMILKPGKERSLLRLHPWIFSGAINSIKGDAKPGDILDVLASDGRFLAQAAFSPESNIRGRVWSWVEGERIDKDLLRNRLERAIIARKSILDSGRTNSVRLIHSESDGFPGLIVDQYGDVLILQISSWAVEPWRDEIAELLVEIAGKEVVFERSDLDIRELEGMPERIGLLSGDNLPKDVKVIEHGLKFQFDLARGHKTGFYLDQRDNRLLLREFTQGAEVLDCFSYTGGFTLNALSSGASHVTSVDSSADALELLIANAGLNELSFQNIETLTADVFQLLRSFRDAARQFDVIILDPPKFAPTRSQAEKAARGYKDINLLAFKLLRPGGILFTFSCSGGVDAALFQKIVAGAALDANVNAQILHTMTQAADHPVALNFPEGSYLKGLVCRV